MQILMSFLRPRATVCSSSVYQSCASQSRANFGPCPLQARRIVCRAAMTSKDPKVKAAGKAFADADLGMLPLLIRMSAACALPSSCVPHSRVDVHSHQVKLSRCKRR